MIACKSGCLAAALLMLAAPAMGQQVGSGDVALGASGAQQDFDGLAASGQSAAVPAGWYFHETDSNADTTYRAGDGSVSRNVPGDTYSLGTNGRSERALGAVLSGSLNPTLGARVRNDSGQVVDEIEVAYTGEQWRLGTSGRTDRLDFQYSLDADSLLDADATWVDVAALRFAAPNSAGTVGALDGNAGPNREAIVSTIAGLALAPGETLWIRWRDHNASGADDALGIDDLTLLIDGETPVDVAPEVSTTYPADGAMNIALDATLEVTFSEGVTVASGWYELTCGGTAAPATTGGGPVDYTITPDSALPADQACELSIQAAAVTDLDGEADNLAADVTVSFVTLETSGDGYYSQVNTASPEQLRCTLNLTIRGHTAYPYSGGETDSWAILEVAQEDPADPDRIIDAYRNRSYDKINDRSGQGGSGPWYNREHTWPNSLGFPDRTDSQGRPNAPYTDAHMLHLTDQDYNAARGNRPLAYCDSSCSERTTQANQGVGGGSGSYPGNSNWVRDPNGNQGSFEVWNHRKGDIARAVLYMAIRYEGDDHPVTGQSEPDLELTNDRSDIQTGAGGTRYMGILDDLLAWHQADPPSAEELVRNDVVQSYQGNRNPFVDHPEWASPALFASESPAVCQPGQADLIFSDRLEAAP